ncbi:MAG: hypothetical protein GX142_01685 [Chloroflexi bacterium]|jgi:hypothetical protein|nr:hypothetical protein [Chloroflexota bacterium]
MSKRKLVPLIIILLIILSGCHFPNKPWVLVEFTNLEDEQQVLLNEELHIIALARSSQGIAKVELFINGTLESIDAPIMGHPREHTVDLPFIPTAEGDLRITAIASDRKGTVSEPLTINLTVVTSLDETDAETTLTPTISQEELAQTQTAQAGCTNSASFVEHITIPEGTQISANTNFSKIWRVNNNGTCDWAGYQVIHSNGNPMAANSPQALPIVKAGANADIVIEMAAPPTPGSHSAVWRIQAGDGSLFGPDLVVSINVPELPTSTPMPTTTPTQTPSPIPTATQTWTPIPPSISVQQITEQISIPSQSTGFKTLTCPSGSMVVSGGFSHDSGIYVWQSIKSDNGWRITATNSHTKTRKLTITATCLFNSNGTSSAAIQEKPAKANDLTKITVSCPSGSLITGGGWAVENNTPITVTNSSKSENGWQIEIFNSTSKLPKVTAYAICMSGVPGATYQMENAKNDVPPNSTAGANKICPSESNLTGGGFSIDRELVLYHSAIDGDGWINFVSNPTGEEKRLDTFAICYQP